MKKLTTLFLFWTIFVHAQTTVFYFEQQSNSAGIALNTTLDTSLNQPITNCMFWNGSTFAQLTPANCQYPYQTGTTSGAILEVMKKYQQHFGGTVYGVMYSVGNTPLADLGTTASFYPLRRGTYFDAGCGTFNAAMAYLWNTLNIRTNYKFYFIPQGGENDAANSTYANAYRANLTNLISGWLNNINTSAFSSAQKIVIIPKISLHQSLNAANTGIVQLACDSVCMLGVAGITNIIDFSQDNLQWSTNSGNTGLHHTALGYKQEGDVIEAIIESQ